MAFDNFLKLMDNLLSEGGCPWDREQTHESLRQYLLEECYETIEAINKRDMDSLKEELGDMLLQVVFHAKLAEKAGVFTMEDVIKGVCNKLISRHTHVFGVDKATSAADVIQVWEANKQKERRHSPKDAMQAVPKALPALVRAAKILKRSPAGMPTNDDLYNDIHDKLNCLKEADEQCFEDFGKLLLSLVSVSVILDINAEFSLTNAVEGFINTVIAKPPVKSGLYD